eukprot:14944158-Heterocapsa_arctica.AAC.1
MSARSHLLQPATHAIIDQAGPPPPRLFEGLPPLGAEGGGRYQLESDRREGSGEPGPEVIVVHV